MMASISWLRTAVSGDDADFHGAAAMGDGVAGRALFAGLGFGAGGLFGVLAVGLEADRRDGSGRHRWKTSLPEEIGERGREVVCGRKSQVHEESGKLNLTSL
jgi:hypothetical protein